MDIPRIISVDDHVVEPPDVWQARLPRRWRERGPQVRRIVGRVTRRPRYFSFREDPEGYAADCWVYEGRVLPITSGFAAVCFERDEVDNHAVCFDELLPGCTDPAARVVDLDRNHTEASLCFPTFSRFCGQSFLEGEDKDLALACVQAYNDWMIEEWCGGPARARLIPLTLVPMWDPDAAAAEVRRCAGKGSYSICFSENPAALDLPSIHSGAWDPLWAACQETATVVNMHIGSSSSFPRTARDAPELVTIALTFEGAAGALADWLCSGVLERFGTLRIALSEGQVGWMPFLLERLDHAWDHARAYGGTREQVPRPPSTYVPGRVFGCIFDDLSGLAQRDLVGMDQIMFETDYPHGDSTWPRSVEVVEQLASKASLTESERYKLVRGNAIGCYGLDRFGIKE